MVQTSYIKSAKEVWMGAMFDLCSTDHYITHKKERKLGYRGVEVELILEGIKGVEYKEQTMIYDVFLIDLTWSCAQISVLWFGEDIFCCSSSRKQELQGTVQKVWC